MGPRETVVRKRRGVLAIRTLTFPGLEQAYFCAVERAVKDATPCGEKKDVMSVITAVFFDIDGTLIDAHGAGREAFSRALEIVFGKKDDLQYGHFAGGPDLDIFREVRNGKDLKPTK